MKTLTTYFMLPLIMLGLHNCTDSLSSTDNQNTALTSFSMVAVQSVEKSARVVPFTIVDNSGTVFTIAEARVNVRYVMFELTDEINDTESIVEDEIKIEGPFVFDLLNNTSSPDVGTFTVPSGMYKKIEVRLDDIESDDIHVSPSDELYGNTMILKGTFDYKGNANRKFTFILKFNEDVRFENDSGIVIDSVSANDILVKLNITDWLAGIDLTTCLDNGELVLDSNGDLYIDEESAVSRGDCDNLEDLIKENIKSAYEIEDENDDDDGIVRN